ncbi:uncharacterized protein TRIVIDRAFT_30516 [Trichoderma virens Gv29-8]|uniref:Uncharacterized protein n=1 Tax=Hypocrea virens (strain Gv29-8 / FGSC 10586) TaxID=413071 RepID=G9MMB2_HYPVG|nr:uncharacterized protein TRIVIDRAFT_30516 [Trichoderma virens Gv29-8]EHK24481.1 hypothetical protein TRIVIDRAFT_30516 [Trichoderma virens Gv29-8]UKZ54752.1 hypothetical protein TrVGV298_008564 [Trichoderma virens]
MPQTENFSKAPDEGSITMSGEMDIAELMISSRSLTSLYLKVGGTVCPEKLGWVSCVKICLYYDRILLGEITVPDTLMIPDADNYVEITTDSNYDPFHYNDYPELEDGIDHEMKIKTMVGFKSFITSIMPENGVSHEPSSDKRATAAFSIDSTGHNLTMAIDLSNVANIKATTKTLEMTGAAIDVVITMMNPGPLHLRFKTAYFILKQGNKTIGMVSGEFNIVPGEFEVVLEGECDEEIEVDKLNGTAVLKGDSCCEEHSTWLQYAIRQFEIEVDLDGTVIDIEDEKEGDDNWDEAGEDDEDESESESE